MIADRDDKWDDSIRIDRRHDNTYNVTNNNTTNYKTTNYNTRNQTTYNYYNGDSKKPKSKKMIIGIVIACIVLVVAVICIVGVVNSKSVEETYTLSITSNPSGAKIFFDEVFKGTTPLTVSNIATGTHVIRATMADYTDYSNVITVTKSGSLDPIILTKRTDTQPTVAQSTYTQSTYVSPTYTVTFNTGSYGSIASQTVREGDCVSRPASPSRSGYEFSGWYTSPSYTNKWDFNTPVTEDVVLYAKWTAPAGSAESPIEISSASEFMKIYTKPSLYYKLTADIDLTGYSIPNDVTFRGSLDGNEHTITGNTNGNSISIDSTKFSSTKYFGLFSTNSGTIKNLKLVNFGVVGADQDYVNIGDKKAYAYFGCVAGLNAGTISGVTLTDCNMNDGRMWGGCGLIAGLNKGTISDCTINGGHLTADCDVGGVAGVNEGTVHSCSIQGTGSEFIKFYENSWVVHVGYNGRSIGGIVGWASTGSSVIESCSVNDITISCEYRVDKCYRGSIAGSNAGKVSDCIAVGVSPTMEKCGANSGTIS